MKDEYAPIKIRASVKKKVITIQGKLMTKLKRKVSLNETIKLMADSFKP